MSATTCNSRLLKISNTESQLDYLSLMPFLGKDDASNCCPCPHDLIMAIIHINVLRTMLYQTQPSPSMNLDQRKFSAFQKRLENILNLILSFNPNNWAMSVVSSHHSINPGCDKPRVDNNHADNEEEETAGWTTLAQCYQSATLIYCLCSLSPFPTTTILPPIPSSHGTMSNLHETAMQNLAVNLHRVFHGSRPSHQRNRTPFWKFVCWPLFIAGFAEAGCREVSPEDETVPPRCLPARQLRNLAQALGARSMLDAEGLLRRVWSERDARVVVTGAGKREAGDWDEAFSERCVFIM